MRKASLPTATTPLDITYALSLTMHHIQNIILYLKEKCALKALCVIQFMRIVFFVTVKTCCKVDKNYIFKAKKYTDDYINLSLFYK